MSGAPRTFFSLDVATRCGWALWTDRGSESPAVSCGSWPCIGRDFDEKCAVLSDHLTETLRGQRRRQAPVVKAAIEAPIRRLPTRKRMRDDGVEVDELASNPHTMLVLPAMIGAACAILRQFGVPWTIVAPSTWRKVALGTGRAPVGKGTAWFKSEMRMRAEILGAKLDFRVPNHDAADAVGIAIWLAAQSGRLPVGVLTGRGPSLFSQVAAE